MTPLVRAARAVASTAVVDTNVHQDAPSAIISLSWALLVIPCVLLVAAFAWIIYKFSQPSEFPQANGHMHADYNSEEEEQGGDEKDQLLDAFHDSRSHSDSTRTLSGSPWKINSKFSTTSRGGSVHNPNFDPNAKIPRAKASTTSSPKSKRSGLGVDGTAIRPVGSRVAEVLAHNRNRMMQDLEHLDPIDREELQCSSPRTNNLRKSD